MAEIIGDGIVSIKADVKECVDFFENLAVSEKSVSKAIMRSVGQGGRRAVKRNYPTVLKKRTGELYKSIKYKVYRSGGSVVITNSAQTDKHTSKDGRVARYGFMLASGYTIEAKKKSYLTFNVNGKWVKVKQVTVHEKDFTEGPVNRYLDSSTCTEDIDKAFQKQIDRVEKKLEAK